MTMLASTLALYIKAYANSCPFSALNKANPKLLVIGVLLINLFVAVLAGLWLDHSWCQDQEEAKITTRNLARVMQENIAGVISKIDVALLSTADEVSRQNRNGDIDAPVLNRFLAEQQAHQPEIISLRVTDAQGWVKYGLGVGADTHVNVADRDYFVRARDDPQPKPVISQPVFARISKQWVLPISRRFDRGDGDFAGVVYVNIALEHLMKTFSSVNVGPHGMVNLKDDKLKMVARYPEPDGVGSIVGMNTLTAQLQRALQANPEVGTYMATSVVDHRERVCSYRKIPGFPLYITVGLAADDYLAGWRIEAIQVSALVVLFFVVSAVSVWSTYRAWMRQTTATEALAKQEAKFHTVADFTYDWEYWIGPNREIIYMTPSCERFTGYTSAEFAADSDLINRIVHPEDRPIVESHLRDDIYHDNSMVDFRVLRRDGTTRWIAHGCRAVLGPNGQFLGRRVSNRDITDRIEMEQALRESEFRHKALFEHMSSGVAIYQATADGQDFIFIDLNEAAERSGGMRREDVIGRNVVEIFPGITEFGLLDVFRRVWQSGVAEHFPLSFYQDGRISGWRENYVYKLQNGEIVAIFDDVTERMQMQAELQEMATTDSLTGLFNRRHFFVRLEEELARLQRVVEQPVAVLMLDLDHFKKINDRYGHATGDTLLKHFAALISEGLRKIDTVGRIGGEEFAIILPGADLLAGQAFAERIRQKVAETPLRQEGRIIPVTVSIGVAAMSAMDDSVETALGRADKALYRAKNAGRNRVVS